MLVPIRMGTSMASHKKNCYALKLGESVCIVTFFLFSESGLNLSNGFDFYYSGSAGEPESENATVFLAKRRVMVPGVPCVDQGNWGQELALCECRVLRRIFWQESRLLR